MYNEKMCVIDIDVIEYLGNEDNFKDVPKKLLAEGKSVIDAHPQLIKVKYAPDTELTGDLGTFYIVTEHQGFIKTLESITDYKVMPLFLDANKQYYTELVKTPEHYDKEIDVSEQCLKNIQDDSMPFSDKQISNVIDIPKADV